MTLSLKHVSKLVGSETHIDDIELELKPGSLTVLLGLTLAGKTTLMRLMAGLDRPSHGHVSHHGQDIVNIPLRKRNVAMVYQQFINYPSMTVFGNIASPLRIAHVPKAEIKRRVQQEAERLGIAHLLDRLPGELSGGQQQRTAMARALVRNAQLLLLDEPLVNLDYKLREGLRADLSRIFAQRESIVVYATTDPAEALALGGNTAVLHEGRLVQHGSTLDVYNHPATEHVAAVFSDPPMNIVPGEIREGELFLGQRLRLPLPEHFRGLSPGDYRFGVRPYHLAVAEEHSDDQQVLDGAVEVAEISGSDTTLHVLSDAFLWIAVLDGVHSLNPGDRVRLRVQPQRLMAFDRRGQLLVAPAVGTAGNEVMHGTH